MKGTQNNRAGFSLLEMIIVVATILVIAAVAIPNVLRSRASANEASAIASLNVLAHCLNSYRVEHPSVGYPQNIRVLSPQVENCIDQPLADATEGGEPKGGYTFSYTRTNVIGMMATGYALTARPVECNRTGNQTFYMDESRAARFENAPQADCPEATQDSQLLN